MKFTLIENGLRTSDDVLEHAPKVYIFKPLRGQWDKLREPKLLGAALSLLVTTFPFHTWLITSIITSKNGVPRPGGTHEKGLSFDVLPSLRDGSFDITVGETQLKINDKIHALWECKKSVDAANLPVVINFESDHIHVQSGPRPMVTLGRGYKTAFPGDMARASLNRHWAMEMTSGGALIPLSREYSSLLTNFDSLLRARVRK